MALPFTDDPYTVLLAVAAVALLAVMDQIYNGGYWLAKLTHQNTADRMRIRPGLTLPVAGRDMEIGEAHVIQERTVMTEAGPIHEEIAAVRSVLGEDLGAHSNLEILPSWAAFTSSEPARLTFRSNEIKKLFADEKKTQNRIAVLEAETTQAHAYSYDNGFRFTEAMGAWRKNAGWSQMFMQPGRNSSNYTGQMPAPDGGGEQ